MTPRTEAGQALLQAKHWHLHAPLRGCVHPCSAAADLAAIEAEMLALVRERVIAEHQSIREYFGAGPDEHVGIPAAAILGILDELEETP